MTIPGTSIVTTRVPITIPPTGSPFDTITYALATRFLAQSQVAKRHVRRFVEGDHWQKGEGWVGPHIPSGAEGYQKVMEEIEKAFTSRNAIAEVIDRHVGGVVGIEPTWGFTVIRPLEEEEQVTTEEETLIDEAEAFLTEWWDKRNAHNIIADYVKDLCWAAKSSLRVFVPPGVLEEREDDTGQRYLVASATDTEDALMRFMYPEHPAPEDSTVFVDQDTQAWLGVVQYRQHLNWITTGVPIVELTYLTQDRKTVIRRLNLRQTEQYEFDLGGRLTLWESTQKALVSQQIVQAQRALNLAISMLPRNVVTGGFLERVLLNAQMPGKWILDDQNNRIGFEPAQYVTGPGTTNFVQGTEFKDEAGNTKLSTPSIQWRPPSAVTPVIESADSLYEQILGEAKQVHILIAGFATASGYSREQARADFEGSLKTTAGVVVPAVRWMLETVLAFAEQIAGVPGKYTSQLRAVVTCQISTGPISVQERAQNVAEYEANVLSEDECMSRNGVLDVDAEKQRISSQPNATLSLLTTQAEVMLALTQTGFSTELAAEMAGVDKKWIDKYSKENQFPSTDAQGNPLDTKTGNPLAPPPLPTPTIPGKLPPNTPLNERGTYT